MSCQPYLQWWISPRAHLLLKTDHLVSLALFPPPSLRALLILPLLPCSPSSSITESFICLSHSPPSCCCAVIFFPCTSCLRTFLYNCLRPPAISSVEWLMFMTPTKEHICSLPIPCCLFPCCRSPLCSTCLHTSAASPHQTVFCPFNILHRWRGHLKLQYPQNPL